MTGSSWEFSGTGTNLFQYQDRYFFRDQIFRYQDRYFFPGPIFSGTGAGTIQKGAKSLVPGIPGTGMSHSACQISDLADKLETWDNNMGRGAYVMGHDSTDRKAEDKLSKVRKN